MDTIRYQEWMRNIGVVLVSLYFVYYNFAVQKRYLRPKIDRVRLSYLSNNPKYILYYTTFQNQSYNWVTGTKKRMFPRKGCDVLNCIFTSNRSMLNSISDFDAIIFRLRRPNFIDANGSFIMPDPNTRKLSQRYIAYRYEPINMARTGGIKPEAIKGLFNWSMTYNLDSDLPMPYGWFDPIEYENDDRAKNNESRFPADYTLKWRNFDRDGFQKFLDENRSTLEAFAARPRVAAWVASHCGTPSKREDYAYELANHTDLGVYGRCGQPCDRLKWNGSTECIKAIENNFKFYLAFENNLCEDYVTEKFWYALMRNQVPVVLGGADYSKIAPPRSYLDVRDFPSAKALADRLNFLHNNDTEYLTYHWWREHYVVTFGGHHKNRNAWCDLCKRLNNPDEPAGDIGDYFGRIMEECKEPNWKLK